jgi:hypothetical protein
MSTAAEAKGAAMPVEAVTGPGLALHQQVGLALAEVAAAEDRAAKARMKLEKLREHQATAEVETTALVDAAEAEAEAALAAACELTGIDDREQVAELAAAHAAELERHEAELAKLVQLAGGGE